MIPRQPLITFNWKVIASIILSCLSLCALLQRPTAAAKDKPASTQSNIKVATTTANGVITANLVTPHGRVSVFLPDDMAAGDTISGAVRAEPAGATSEERQRNYEALVQEVTKDLMKLGAQGFGFDRFAPQSKLSTSFKLHLDETAHELTWGANRTFTVPVLPPAVLLPTSPGFLLPNLGQAGRPIQVAGNFDGDSSNTGCTVGGKPAPVLAESPRKAVFESPQDIVGQTQITVREQGKESQGSFRNIDVRLTAPKTALTKGETTTVTIEVSGLENLEQSVPLDLDCSGAANMAGGNQQNLQIKPGDVKANGTVTQTRQITGKQAGAFAVNANVKANNQPCSLTGQIVHVEGEPYGGNQGVWKVKIKLQNGTQTEIVIQSDQKPNLRFCNWIQINSCKDGVVPAEDRHGYDLTKEPMPKPTDPRSAGTKPTPSPTPKPSPADLPKSPSTGCTPPGATKNLYRVESQPIHIVDPKSGFKLEIKIIKDTEGREEAQGLAAWFRGISNLGGLIAGKLPRGAPDIGMGANVAALIFAELDAGADILDAASRARMTSMDPTIFKFHFEVETTLITPYCDSYEICLNEVWVKEKKYGQAEAKSKITITKTIDSSSGDWKLVSSGPNGRFDAAKAEDYARGLVKGVFAGLSTNPATLATAQTGCN